jgi:hypothetical protein
MNVTPDQLKQQLGAARAHGWLSVIAQAEQRHSLSAGLLLAIASRETNMTDEVGDEGHGRGLFQIDDRSHADFLAREGAGGPGATPPIPAAADYAASMLASSLAGGKSSGVAANMLVKFACSAYNAGMGNAWSGYHDHGDSDRFTTGGDYGQDVIERLAAIAAELGQGSGGVPAQLLEVGVRGAAVTQLKSDLQVWFDVSAPGEWETFGVDSSNAFGAALAKAVRVFQQRNDLVVDGEVGPKTGAAISAAAANARRSKVATT